MKTLLYQRDLPHEWFEIPFKDGHLRVGHQRFELVVIESVDDVPEMSKWHHLSISHRGARARANDKEVIMAILLFMDPNAPVEEDPPVNEKYVRHLWQPVE